MENVSCAESVENNASNRINRNFFMS